MNSTRYSYMSVFRQGPCSIGSSWLISAPLTRVLLRLRFPLSTAPDCSDIIGRGGFPLFFINMLVHDRDSQWHKPVIGLHLDTRIFDDRSPLRSTCGSVLCNFPYIIKYHQTAVISEAISLTIPTSKSCSGHSISLFCFCALCVVG